jgi:hypothetical protein
VGSGLFVADCFMRMVMAFARPIPSMLNSRAVARRWRSFAARVRSFPAAGFLRAGAMNARISVSMLGRRRIDTISAETALSRSSGRVSLVTRIRFGALPRGEQANRAPRPLRRSTTTGGSAALTVASTPRAVLFIDGVRVGQTPITGRKLTVGPCVSNPCGAEGLSDQTRDHYRGRDASYPAQLRARAEYSALGAEALLVGEGMARPRPPL